MCVTRSASSDALPGAKGGWIDRGGNEKGEYYNDAASVCPKLTPDIKEQLDGFASPRPQNEIE
jgi:hypothetical protein